MKKTGQTTILELPSPVLLEGEIGQQAAEQAGQLSYEQLAGLFLQQRILFTSYLQPIRILKH
ncbi:hypothetical protein GCM10020331_088960 [Ectobacillus funiculus]